MEKLTMSGHNHLVCVDIDTRKIVVFRVDDGGNKSILTKTDLPAAPGWSKELEEIARRLGENLLMDSPAARQLLDI
jgi:hypothetical protein